MWLSFLGKLMSSVNTNQFKPGLKILLDNDPYAILENEFVKPGKGQAFNRVKLRNLKNGKVIEKTFKSGDSVEVADIVELEMQFLYYDGSDWVFMNETTYEQVTVSKTAMRDSEKWLKGQEKCEITLWDGLPIIVLAPNFVELIVSKTDPGLKGDTASGGTKPAELETGAVVKVPLFIEEAETLKIDTRTGEYVSRVKK